MTQFVISGSTSRICNGRKQWFIILSMEIFGHMRIRCFIRWSWSTWIVMLYQHTTKYFIYKGLTLLGSLCIFFLCRAKCFWWINLAPQNSHANLRSAPWMLTRWLSNCFSVSKLISHWEHCLGSRKCFNLIWTIKTIQLIRLD